VSEAAATPMPALTAQQALFDHGRLAAGQTVLIHGAAGGVGAVAIQLAHAAGARVLACARASARDFVLELGADEFIDADGRPFEEAADGVDLVFDLVGREVLERSWSVLRAGGAIVSAVEDPAARGGAGGERRGAFFVVEASGAQLGALAAPIEAGELRPVVGEVRPLAQGRQAFAAKRGGGVRGKSVLMLPG
jgi:NADPH:quinone reductase-like Zn-dependent oxidoreductase